VTNFPNWPDPAPRPTKNRKPLLITAGATVAVLTVIAIVVALLMGRGDDNGGGTFDPSGSPTEVAKAYLEALARGDAKGALNLSATQPATTDLLTDDILKQQLDKMPITEIEILGEEREPDADKRTSAVKVAAKLGGQRTEGKLETVVVDNQWKLSAAFVDGTPVEIRGYADEEALDALTVFGEPLPQSRHFYVFPGYIEMGARTPYFTLNELPPTTFDDVTALKDTTVKPKYVITDAGIAAAKEALSAWIGKCYNGADESDGCEGTKRGWQDQYDLNTLRVRGPVDMNPVEIKLPDHTTLARVSGLRIPFTVVEKGTGRTVDNETSTSDFLSVDLGEQPPRVFIEQ
jgi:hypothetical protein